MTINAERLARDIIVIGASAGGVEALIKLFEELPPSFSTVIGATLHRHPTYNLNLAKVLGRRSAMPMKEPQHDERLTSGMIYLAPRDHHMLFMKGRVELNRGPKEHFTRPAIDPLFASASAAYGRRVIGVLLTGAGSDGVVGMIAIKNRGGIAIVQDPKEARIPMMPISAVTQDHVDLVLPLAGIAAALGELANGHAIERAS
jgi:two-component system, chemotaxis family, protein-glutamate methylesterase/glutaminase